MIIAGQDRLRKRDRGSKVVLLGNRTQGQRFSAKDEVIFIFNIYTLLLLWLDSVAWYMHRPQGLKAVIIRTHIREKHWMIICHRERERESVFYKSSIYQCYIKDVQWKYKQLSACMYVQYIVTFEQFLKKSQVTVYVVELDIIL